MYEGFAHPRSLPVALVGLPRSGMVELGRTAVGDGAVVSGRTVRDTGAAAGGSKGRTAARI